MGDHFGGVWQSNHCPPTLKKMIFRTAIEEIIVRTDQDKKTLDLVIHWKGGAHTQLAVERPRSATETATPIEARDHSSYGCSLRRRPDCLRVEPTWLFHGQREAVESDSCGDSPAQPFHCRSKTSSA